jgi:hypothetical protein
MRLGGIFIRPMYYRSDLKSHRTFRFGEGPPAFPWRGDFVVGGPEFVTALQGPVHDAAIFTATPEPGRYESGQFFRNWLAKPGRMRFRAVQTVRKLKGSGLNGLATHPEGDEKAEP